MGYQQNEHFDIHREHPNPATLVSQDARNIGRAGNSSFLTSDTVSSTTAMREESQTMDSTQLVRTSNVIAALV